MHSERKNTQNQKAPRSTYSNEPPFSSFFDHFFRTHQWPGDDGHPDLSLLPTPPAELKPLIMSIVRAGYRVQAKRSHPDAGGSVESMRALSEAKEWLERSLKL